MSEVNQKKLGRVLQMEGMKEIQKTPCFQCRVHKFELLVGETRFYMLFSTPEERDGLFQEQRRWEGVPLRGPMSKASVSRNGSFCVGKGGNVRSLVGTGCAQSTPVRVVGRVSPVSAKVNG